MTSTPPPPHHNRFTAVFPGPPGWAGPRKELLDFMVQGEINRGRHTDHLAGCYSIRTNQCPHPPSPHIFYGPDALPAAKPAVSKHWRQLAHMYLKKQKSEQETCFTAIHFSSDRPDQLDCLDKLTVATISLCSVRCSSSFNMNSTGVGEQALRDQYPSRVQWWMKKETAGHWLRSVLCDRSVLWHYWLDDQSVRNLYHFPQRFDSGTVWRRKPRGTKFTFKIAVRTRFSSVYYEHLHYPCLSWKGVQGKCVALKRTDEDRKEWQSCWELEVIHLLLSRLLK